MQSKNNSTSVKQQKVSAFTEKNQKLSLAQQSESAQPTNPTTEFEAFSLNLRDSLIRQNATINEIWNKVNTILRFDPYPSGDGTTESSEVTERDFVKKINDLYYFAEQNNHSLNIIRDQLEKII